MSIAFISDIHGNFPALEAVLENIFSVDKNAEIISLGDIVGYYCMPNECIKMLRKYCKTNIMGNHDYYMIKNLACPRSHVVNETILWQKQHISPENFEWLSQTVPLLDRNFSFSARHGGWNDILDEYVQTFDFQKNQKFHLYISGHTHIQTLMSLDNATYCNPGSVGQPRDNNPYAAWALFDDNGISLHRVKYDIDQIAQQMKQNGFEERLYTCLYEGSPIKPNNTTKSF